MTVQAETMTEVERCPCRECSSRFYGGMPLPQEMAIARTVERFVTDEPRWQTPVWAYPLSWLENELDEVLGVTHARWMTQQLRAMRDRA